MSLSSHIMITSTNGFYKRRIGHGGREHVVYECLAMVLDLQIPRNVGSVQWKADLVYDTLLALDMERQSLVSSRQKECVNIAGYHY